MKPGDILKQIVAKQDDLSLRQVYADMLIDAGDPRGTFISHQIELERLDPLDERYAPMLASVRRLETANGEAWLGELKSRSPIYKNGFLHRISLQPQEIAKQWKSFTQTEPIAGIELLVHEHLPEEFRELTEPKAFRVLKVSPEEWFTSNSLANVLSWGMPHLHELDLSGCDVGSTGARLLANLETDLGDSFDDYVAPPPFAKGQLTRLILHACQLGDVGAQTLFTADHLTEVTELDISQCRMTSSDSLVALTKAKSLGALRSLSIAGNRFSPAALAGWDVIPKLTSLALPQVSTAEEFKLLFKKPSKALRSLDLSSAKELMTAPQQVLASAEAFTALDLGTTSMGDGAWALLLAAPSTKHLIHLHANGCSLSDDAVSALTKSKLKRLVTLDLSSNKLTDAAIETLADWDGLETLTDVRLGNNRKVKSYDALINAKAFKPARFDLGKQSDAKLTKKLRERFGDALVITQ